MNKALRLMFWGYLFIFFRLQIGIDLLAAPIGYYMIYSGARIMTQYVPVSKKVEVTAFIGILISVPGVFINLPEVTDGVWLIYAHVLLIWKMITVYYLFTAWKEVWRGAGQSLIRQRMQLVYMLYMIVHFTFLLSMAFSLNIGGTFELWLIFNSVAVVGMDIVLLITMAALRRAVPEEMK